jgi:Cof subfamily protein (haloacid dehalogenase superfamily)
LKLIVTDLDGTLLNEECEISAQNAQTLLAAEAQGIEVAVATGRNYGNAKAVCERAGLRPHIICNNGSFVYTKEGKKIAAIALGHEHISHAVDWLGARRYFYTLCTAHAVYIPKTAKEIVYEEYKQAVNIVEDRSMEEMQEGLEKYMAMDTAVLVDDFSEVLARHEEVGNISVITLDLDKLQHGRNYFSEYPGMAMAVAGSDIFEMIHNEASKGSALEKLAKHLGVALGEAMAIGDNYNDLSMLRKAGISVAIGNAEEDVKKACMCVSLTNVQDGVAHIVQRFLRSRAV